MVVIQKGDQTIPVCSECSKGHHGVQFLTMGSQFHIPIVHCTLHIASDGMNTVDSRANNTGDTHFDFPVLLLVCETALWLEHFTVHVTIASFCRVFHTRIICPLIHTAPVTPLDILHSVLTACVCMSAYGSFVVNDSWTPIGGNFDSWQLNDNFMSCCVWQLCNFLYVTVAHRN